MLVCLWPEALCVLWPRWFGCYSIGCGVYGFELLQWGFRGLEVETLEGFDCYAIALAAPSR